MSRVDNVHVPCKASGVSSVPFGLGGLFFEALQTLEIWYERSKQRRRLAQLDDHLLRDIGIDRLAAMEEMSKPFWQE